MAATIRKGDKVKVIAGQERGNTGTVFSLKSAAPNSAPKASKSACS